MQGLIRQESLAVINAINEVKVPVLSVDVPSGLNATTGVAFCGCVQADMTVTFIGIKQGLVIAAGKEASGVLKFADLDVVKHLLKSVHQIHIYSILNSLKSCSASS